MDITPSRPDIFLSQPVCFKFEGTPYKVTIEGVKLFPQGYSESLSTRNLYSHFIISAKIHILNVIKGIPFQYGFRHHGSLILMLWNMTSKRMRVAAG